MRNRTLKPQTEKYKVSQDEIDDIREKSKQAKELVQSSYLMEYFTEAKQQILDIHAKQSLTDSTEETEKNGIKRTFKYPAVKEYTLLAGQYRFIDQFLSDLEFDIERAKQLEERIKADDIEIYV